MAIWLSPTAAIEPWFGGMEGGGWGVPIGGVEDAELAECFPVSRSHNLTARPKLG